MPQQNKFCQPRAAPKKAALFIPQTLDTIYIVKKYHPSSQQILSLIKEKGLWHESFEHEPVTTSDEAAKIRTGYTLEQGAKAIIVSVKEKNGGGQNGNQNNNRTNGQTDSRAGSPDQPTTPKKYFAQFVVPGDAKINSKKLTKLLNAKSIRFATAEEISELTNGIKIGGIPPLGNLFNIPVYVDPTLLENKKIIFNAGDRSFSIALKTKDYLDLVQPEILSFVQD